MELLPTEYYSVLEESLEIICSMDGLSHNRGTRQHFNSHGQKAFHAMF
jgi:hypothetical protein